SPTAPPPAGDPVRSDLADDGYAPARAYEPEPRTDAGPEGQVSHGAPGRAPVARPLWPERPAAEPPTAPAAKGRGRGRRRS
ncbi:MAG TPA: hypothetical protein VNV66_19810, partial [Pilimelia sp.]|nr:hypothetical protein [Pilimelia sp.]